MTRPLLTASLVALAAVAVLLAPRLTPAPQAPLPQIVEVPAIEDTPVAHHVFVETRRPDLLIPEATDTTPIRSAPPPRIVLPEVADVPDLMDGCPPCGMG